MTVSPTIATFTTDALSNGRPNVGVRRFSSVALPLWAQHHSPIRSSSCLRVSSQPQRTSLNVPQSASLEPYENVQTVESGIHSAVLENSKRSPLNQPIQKDRLCNSKGCFNGGRFDGVSAGYSGTLTSSSDSTSSNTSELNSIPQLPIPKGRAAETETTLRGMSDGDSSVVWDLKSRYMKVARTGPTSWPAHIQIKEPGFLKTGPSPLLLYYYDETAPNSVLLANDVRPEHTFQNSKAQLMNLLTCQGGRQEDYTVDGEVYTLNVPVTESLPVDELSTSEGSDSHCGSSTYTSDNESAQPPKSGCCGTGRSISVRKEITRSYSSTSGSLSTSISSGAVPPYDPRCTSVRGISNAHDTKRGISNPQRNVDGIHRSQPQQPERDGVAFGQKSNRKTSMGTSVSFRPGTTGCLGRKGRQMILSKNVTNHTASDVMSSSVEVLSKYSKCVPKDTYVKYIVPSSSHVKVNQVGTSIRTVPKPQKKYACCGGKELQRQMTDETRLVSEYQQLGQTKQRSLSVQNGSTHTRNNSNTPRDRFNPYIVSQSLHENSLAHATSTQELAPANVTREALIHPSSVLVPSTAPIAPSIPALTTPSGNQSLVGQTVRRQTCGQSALERCSHDEPVDSPPLSIKRLLSTGKPCPQCKGTGVVDEPASRTKRNKCTCCSYADRGGEVPLSNYNPSIRKNTEGNTIHKSGKITHRMNSTGNRFPGERNRGCCGRVDNISVSSYASTSDSCSCSECRSSKSSGGLISHKSRKVMKSIVPNSTSIVPITTNELHPSTSSYSSSDIQSTVSFTSLHHYKETVIPEGQRDYGYTTRKLFFNVEKSPKPGDKDFNSDYNLVPTFSVSYKNYPNICYDAVIPTNYSNFFRQRKPPTRQ